MIPRRVIETLWLSLPCRRCFLRLSPWIRHCVNLPALKDICLNPAYLFNKSHHKITLPFKSIALWFWNMLQVCLLLSAFARVGQFPLMAGAVYFLQYQCDPLCLSPLSFWSTPDRATFYAVSSFHCSASPLSPFGSVGKVAVGRSTCGCVEAGNNYPWGRQVRWQGLETSLLMLFPLSI